VIGKDESLNMFHEDNLNNINELSMSKSMIDFA